MDIIYKITENDIERHAAIDIMEHVFAVELGYSKIRADTFDHNAVFLIAKCNGQIVASLRVVPDSELGLPIDAYADISHVRSKKIMLAEVSRLACLKDFRNRYVAINGISFLKEVLSNMDITHVVIDSFLHSARLYRQLGFKPLGEPIFDSTIFKEGDAPAPNSLVMYAEVQDLIKKAVNMPATTFA